MISAGELGTNENLAGQFPGQQIQDAMYLVRLTSTTVSKARRMRSRSEMRNEHCQMRLPRAGAVVMADSPLSCSFRNVLKNTCRLW